MAAAFRGGLSSSLDLSSTSISGVCASLEGNGNGSENDNVNGRPSSSPRFCRYYDRSRPESQCRSRRPRSEHQHRISRCSPPKQMHSMYTPILVSSSASTSTPASASTPTTTTLLPLSHSLDMPVAMAMQSHAHTHTYAHTNINTHTLAQSHSHSHAHAHTHSHPPTHAHTHSSITMERTPSGNSILSATPSEPLPSSMTSTPSIHQADALAAQRVEGHAKRIPAHSAHERILRKLIRRDEPLDTGFTLDDRALDSVLTAADFLFFDGVLKGRVQWEWSSDPRYHTELIGTTALRRCIGRDGYETLIVLSEPVLKNQRYDRRLLLSAFLHELIHCYLFILCGFEARIEGGHTDGFHRIAAVIDHWVGPRFLSIFKLREDPERFMLGVGNASGSSNGNSARSSSLGLERVWERERERERYRERDRERNRERETVRERDRERERFKPRDTDLAAIGNANNLHHLNLSSNSDTIPFHVGNARIEMWRDDRWASPPGYAGCNQSPRHAILPEPVVVERRYF